MADTEKPRKASKRPLIAISFSSSSSSAYSEDDNTLESESESECYDISSESESEDYIISTDDSVDAITSSTSCDEEDDDDCTNEENEGKDEESMCSRVVYLLRGKSDLQELTLVECKAYLRKYGLRLSGTRAECILRIKEHWRLKDGIGETLYPRSSFATNCTGDVCRGDDVLFTQKVYKRSGSLLGKRTVAGRIRKAMVLPNNSIPSHAGKMKRKDQKFSLRKHRRGAAARRLIREMQRTKAVKRMQKISSTKEANKRQKRFHQHSSSPQMSEAVKKHKHADKHGNTPVVNQKCNYYHQRIPAFDRDDDYHPHYGRPTHGWRYSNDLAGLKTNNRSQSFSYKANSSRCRK